MFLSSLFHKKGPRYLRECLPYSTELNLGIPKFWFLKLYLQDLVLKMSQMKSGTSLYLTLYMSITMSCNLLLEGLVVKHDLISSYTFLNVSYKLSLVPAIEFFQPFLYPTPYRNAM